MFSINTQVVVVCLGVASGVHGLRFRIRDPHFEKPSEVRTPEPPSQRKPPHPYIRCIWPVQNLPEAEWSFKCAVEFGKGLLAMRGRSDKPRLQPAQCLLRWKKIRSAPGGVLARVVLLCFCLCLGWHLFFYFLLAGSLLCLVVGKCACVRACVFACLRVCVFGRLLACLFACLLAFSIYLCLVCVCVFKPLGIHSFLCSYARSFMMYFRIDV